MKRASSAGSRRASVLDAGCGTGRVAIELPGAGFAVVGVDNDPSMLATARSRGPSVTWIQRGPDHPRPRVRSSTSWSWPGTSRCSRHPERRRRWSREARATSRPGGALVVGFQLGRGYELDEYDAHCEEAGLELDGRWATWAREPFPGDGGYAVSLHRRAPAE